MLFVCSSILVLVLAAGCGGGDTTTNLPPAGGGAPGGGAAAPAATATVTGKIAFEGTPPPSERIQMSADPYCQKQNQNAVTEVVKVSDGGLENVIVFVQNAPSASYPTPSEPVLIDQQNCRYTPHVFTMQVNQPMKIKNSDATLHNIHAWAEKNMPFNIGQPVQNMETTKTFTTEEVPLPIRCDVHKWMGAFVGVFSHPYHTVSKSGGTYELKLPAGNYEIVAWHELYGQQSQMVTVADNETKDLAFTFKADAKASD
jgi:hypothetical protein